MIVPIKSLWQLRANALRSLGGVGVACDALMAGFLVLGDVFNTQRWTFA